MPARRITNPRQNSQKPPHEFQPAGEILTPPGRPFPPSAKPSAACPFPAGFLFPDMTGDGKKLESIKIHVDSRLKRLIQDAAMRDDRSVSDWIGVQLKGQLFIEDTCGDFHIDPDKLQEWFERQRGE